jgi:hypothetical protein
MIQLLVIINGNRCYMIGNIMIMTNGWIITVGSQ